MTRGLSHRTSCSARASPIASAPRTALTSPSKTSTAATTRPTPSRWEAGGLRPEASGKAGPSQAGSAGSLGPQGSLEAREPA